ncbi:MAG: hypothetical protein ACRDK5_11820 [Solirubrobacterales bacterium]
MASQKRGAPRGSPRRDETPAERADRNLAGLAVLALALTGAVLLISDILFQGTMTVFYTSVTGIILVTLWALLPLYRRRDLSEAER